MKYLLDTDHISIIQLRSGPEYVALAPRVTQRQTDLASSVIIAASFGFEDTSISPTTGEEADLSMCSTSHHKIVRNAKYVECES